MFRTVYIPELAGNVELRDFVTILRLPPVFEHLAEVGTTCSSCSRWRTCTRPHIHNYMLYKVPIVVMETPYPELLGRCCVPKKCHGNFFFSERLLPRNLWGLLSETSRATNTQGKREREKDESVSCSSTKVGLCFRRTLWIRTEEAWLAGSRRLQYIFPG